MTKRRGVWKKKGQNIIWRPARTTALGHGRLHRTPVLQPAKETKSTKPPSPVAGQPLGREFRGGHQRCSTGPGTRWLQEDNHAQLRGPPVLLRRVLSRRDRLGLGLPAIVTDSGSICRCRVRRLQINNVSTIVQRTENFVTSTTFDWLATTASASLIMSQLMLASYSL